jgi:hypothetical protein
MHVILADSEPLFLVGNRLMTCHTDPIHHAHCTDPRGIISLSPRHSARRTPNDREPAVIFYPSRLGNSSNCLRRNEIASRAALRDTSFRL